MKGDEFKNLSNIQITKDCYKVLKIISIDKEVSLQEVAADILNKVTSKKKQKTQEIDIDSMS